MNNNQKAEYIFQQLVERGAALPHVAVLCIETALNDLDIAAQQSVQSDEGYECHCNAEHAHMTYIPHEEGCPARLRR